MKSDRPNSKHAIKRPPAPHRYVEPELQFAQQRVPTTVDGDEKKVLVTELVKAGQILLIYPGLKRFEQKGFEKKPVIHGKNTEISEDQSNIIATVLGYPTVASLEQNDGQKLLHISVKPLVKLSFNRLTATLCIKPTIGELCGVRENNLEALLAQAGLTYGIDDEAVAFAKKCIREDPIEQFDIVIATGKEPGIGSDAYLDFAIEIGPLAGTIDESGTIDFRERKIMVGVKKGDLIATKIPAVPGTPGMSVLGELIESKTGRDIKVKNYGDSNYASHSGEIRASKDGLLSVTNQTVIKVSSKQTVHGDIDFNTGNIETHGCLRVVGSVQPGFQVDVEGDLAIDGSVMSAQICGGSNALIKGGITGKNASVKLAGDADIKFIEQGRLIAGGLIVIRNQAYFSKVTAGLDIRCAPTSTIAGGTMIAVGHISAGTIGTESSEPATLGAGIDPDRLNQLNMLQLDLADQQNELIKWLQMHRRPQARKVRKMEAAIDALKRQIIKLNLIPGTEPFSRQTTGDCRAETEEESPLYHAGIDVDTIRINIHGTAYPGTRLLLGNRSMVLKQVVSKRQFKLSADMKRIIALPLSG